MKTMGKRSTANYVTIILKFHMLLTNLIILNLSLYLLSRLNIRFRRYITYFLNVYAFGSNWLFPPFHRK